jgi:hypothetical protein
VVQCAHITILKNDGVGQWEGWHPICEMENNGVRQLGLWFPIYRNIKFVPKHQPAICLLVFHLQAMKFYDILLFIAFSCIFFITAQSRWFLCQVLLGWSIPLFLASAGPAAACPSAAARLPRSVSCVSPAQLRTPANYRYIPRKPIMVVINQLGYLGRSTLYR